MMSCPRRPWIALGLGLLVAVGGGLLVVVGLPFTGSDVQPLWLGIGVVMVVGGLVAIRWGRRGLHHTVLDPIGFGLVLLGLGSVLVAAFTAITGFVEIVVVAFGLLAFVLAATVFIRRAREGL